MSSSRSSMPAWTDIFISMISGQGSPRATHCIWDIHLRAPARSTRADIRSFTSDPAMTAISGFGADDPFSLRPGCSFFDSSALVDAETDTLIYPGESGILYLIKLNSVYDEAAGVVSIDPGDIIRWHYYGTRSGDGSFWLGMEDSACVYKGYLFVCDNGGNMMCLDLRTMELVWVQDILDDSNGTPVLSIENGHLYLYVGTSFHLGWRSDSTAPVPIWKIDAENGEIVWQTDFECHSEEGVSGGIQSTVAVGKYDFSDYVYVTVAKTNDYYTGQLVCLRKDSGEIVWEQTDTYTWSSPVCVYNRDGSGAVLYFTFGGDALLIDGLTGEEKCRYSLGEQNIGGLQILQSVRIQA